MKKKFCCPALELFNCLPLWKTVLFISSRAFSSSIPTFSLSTPVDNSEATWKKGFTEKSYKMQQMIFYLTLQIKLSDIHKTYINISNGQNSELKVT